MLTIYWSSVVIGLVAGLAIGVAVALWATCMVDRTTFKESGSDFSHGFNRGWECGVEHQQMIDMGKDGLKHYNDGSVEP